MEFIAGTKPTNKNNIKNLIKLADYLEVFVPPPHFGMAEFVTTILIEDRERFSDKLDDKEEIYAYGETTNPDEIFSVKKTYSCGTVACAIGHGPLAGIGVRKLKFYSNWFDYAEHYFGVRPIYRKWDGITDDNMHYAFVWMFDTDWSSVDDTPIGAAKRIRIYLENGVPANYRNQLDANEPLMYKNNTSD